ncbi:MAG: hemerythrin family protein [Sinobacterium sp.]|nr:hemerythrin family protein [Sinobacterium sp.]
MAAILWDDSFSVNNQMVDDQHQVIFSYVNEFDAAAQAGKATPELLEILDKAIEYTGFHFSEEEALMEKHNYPDISKHKLLHKELVRRALEARDNVAAGQANAAQDAQSFLSFWLKSHIKGVDAKYSSFLH